MMKRKSMLKIIFWRP
uniref:Uncharacterized protein n=1 Tax=Arundo donax TaxID=35708 RepID=A0A0A9A4H8_ARUDO